MNRYRYYDDDGSKKHYHELDGRPLLGTSTVVGVLSKPLTWWAAELAAVECLASGEHIPTIREEYEAAAKLSGAAKKKAMDDLQKKYPAFKKARYAHYDRKNDAAQDGTDMHAELEGYIKLCIESYEGRPQPARPGDIPQVAAFATWAAEAVGRFVASEGHCYSERLWTGGITDCIAQMNDGTLIVIDFKSSKEAYPSQFIQAAGYGIEAEESGILDADGNLLLKLERPIAGYCIFPFGAEVVEPQFRFDIERLRSGFEAATALYQLTNQE